MVAVIVFISVISLSIHTTYAASSTDIHSNAIAVARALRTHTTSSESVQTAHKQHSLLNRIDHAMRRLQYTKNVKTIDSAKSSHVISGQKTLQITQSDATTLALVQQLSALKTKIASDATQTLLDTDNQSLVKLLAVSHK